MSICYRKQTYRDMIFRKNLHLKYISEKLFEVMPKNFSFKDFLSAFIIAKFRCADSKIQMCKYSEFFTRQKAFNLRHSNTN